MGDIAVVLNMATWLDVDFLVHGWIKEANWVSWRELVEVEYDFEVLSRFVAHADNRIEKNLYARFKMDLDDRLAIIADELMTHCRLGAADRTSAKSLGF
jgi:hypothetical protein